MRTRLLSVAVTAILSAGIASAGSLYSYVGQNFTTAISPYTTSDSVSGDFTTTATLAANLTNYSFTPASFSFMDGVSTISSANASSDQFFVSTDAHGNPVAWQIFVASNQDTNQIQISKTLGFFTGDSGSTTAGYGQNFVAGVFTTTTPEPSSIALLSAGFLGFAFVVRRKWSMVGPQA